MKTLVVALIIVLILSGSFIELAGAQRAHAQITVPPAGLCDGVVGWSVVETWVNPPPDALQFPGGVPAPISFHLSCVPAPGGGIELVGG